MADADLIFWQTDFVITKSTFTYKPAYKCNDVHGFNESYLVPLLLTNRSSGGFF